MSIEDTMEDNFGKNETVNTVGEQITTLAGIQRSWELYIFCRILATLTNCSKCFLKYGFLIHGSS